MALLLVILLITVPLAELWLIIEIGGLIGVWPTIAILLVDSLLGAILLNRQGRAAWRRFNKALAERRMPHREVLDGVLIVLGGALLLTPGFLTDAIGLALLLPPVRVLVRKVLTRRLSRRVSRGSAAFFTGAARRNDSPTHDVDGTAEDVANTPTSERMLKG